MKKEGLEIAREHREMYSEFYRAMARAGREQKS